MDKDLKDAFKWVKKAAEQGLPQAQFKLGELYQSGRGTKPDPKEAALWYEKARNQGYPKTNR